MKLLLPLLFVLALCTETALAQPQDLRFENETIPSGTYEATVSVLARNATVQSGSSVTFRAGQTVRLEAGFKAELGATLRAEVDPDVGSGGGGGGPIVLSQMPNALPNVRFYADQFAVVRPALTLRAFDSPTVGGSSYGYGLKQVLERAYDPSYEDHLLVRRVYEQIVQASNDGLADPASGPGSARGVINDNSAVVQSRAFVALATYVLERNGYTTGDYQITPGPPDQTRA